MGKCFMIVWSNHTTNSHKDNTHFVLHEVQEHGFKNRLGWKIKFDNDIQNLAFIKTDDNATQHEVAFVLREEIFKEYKNHVSPIFINEVNDDYPSL